MAIKHNIRNSRLLITFLHCARKHQLSDFFNSYACSRSLSPDSQFSGSPGTWGHPPLIGYLPDHIRYVFSRVMDRQPSA